MLQPLLEAQGGDGEDFLAAFPPAGFVRWEEGRGGDGAGEGGCGWIHVKPEAVEFTGRACIARREGVHPLTLIGQPVHVNLRNRQPGCKPFFRQHGAVFRNHVVAGEYQVSGGLPLPGVRVDITAHQPRRLPSDKLAAVVRFTCYLVGGGQVQNNGGPRLDRRVGRRLNRPQILTDFHANHEVWNVLTAEHLFCVERNVLIAQNKSPGLE